MVDRTVNAEFYSDIIPKLNNVAKRAHWIIVKIN